MKIKFVQTIRNYDRKNLGKDLVAGLIIMAVSIPISMGYAQIAGLPAVYGLYGSVFPILLFALFRPLLDRVPPLAGLLVCALLFLITWWVPGYRDGVFGIPGVLSFPVPDALTEILWLYPLGLSYLPSSDYFPILPWIFCFLGGSFVGVWAVQGRFPAFMYRRRVPFFSWIGKHTLIIYILHQPVIYGICLGISLLVRQFGK